MKLKIKIEMDFFRYIILKNEKIYNKYDKLRDDITRTRALNKTFKEEIIPMFENNFKKVLESNLSHIKTGNKFKIKGKINIKNIWDNYIEIELLKFDNKHYTIKEYQHYVNSLAIEFNTYLWENVSKNFNLAIYDGIVEI